MNHMNHPLAAGRGLLLGAVLGLLLWMALFWLLARLADGLAQR